MIFPVQASPPTSPTLEPTNPSPLYLAASAEAAVALLPEQLPEEKKEEEQVVKEEVEEKEAIPPWGRCLASGPDCPVHSAILPRTHWAFYSSVQEVISQLIFTYIGLVSFLPLVKVKFSLRSICLLTVSIHGVTEKAN